MRVLYFLTVSLLLNFIVGVNSPPGTVKSFSRSTNFLMWAAFDTTLVFDLSTHSWICWMTFGWLQASSEVVRSSERCYLKYSLLSWRSFLVGCPVFPSISTLKVIKAATNLYYSPSSMILLHAAQCRLKLSSIATGAMFSPPEVMINSLILPVITSQLSMILPRSPEAKYPSEPMTFLVASGFFK